MKQHKATFSGILEQSRKQNSERLMAKARAANRLAKKTLGINRKTAYSVKHKALCSLIRKFPEHVRISKDVNLDEFIVVGLAYEQSGLHLPIVNLTGGAVYFSG